MKAPISNFHFFIYLSLILTAVVCPLINHDFKFPFLQFITSKKLNNFQILHPTTRMNEIDIFHKMFISYQNLSFYWPMVKTPKLSGIPLYKNKCLWVFAFGRCARIGFIYMIFFIYMIYHVVQMLKSISICKICITFNHTYYTYNIGNGYSIYVPVVTGWPPFRFLIYFFFMWQNHPT